MSKDTNGVVNLDYVIASVFNELGKPEHELERLTQLAIDGVTALNMFHLNSGEKVTILTVNDAGICRLPSDYIQYLKVGIRQSGRFYTLTRDDQMMENIDRLDGELDSEDDALGLRNDSLYFGGINYNYSGGYNVAYYTINDRTRTLSIGNSVPNNEIILFYISSGISIDEETLIPRQAVMAIKEYVFWRRIENDSNVSLNEKVRKKQNYDEALMNLRAFENPFRMDEYLDMRYGASGQSIKR